MNHVGAEREGISQQEAKIVNNLNMDFSSGERELCYKGSREGISDHEHADANGRMPLIAQGRYRD